MKRIAFLITGILTLFLLFNRVSLATAVDGEYHINVGGADYTALDGTFFEADKAYVAGDYGYDAAGRTFSFGSAIANTDDDTLYQTIRSGFAFDYKFDIPDGEYDVTLHFMEPWQSTAGERLFDVSIEGAVVLDDYDIFAASGGQLTAVSETITVDLTDGQLNIGFNRVSRVAMLSAISVVSTDPGVPAPEITVAPTNLDYGDVEINTSSDLTVAVTNDGTADLNVSSLTSTNGTFTVESPTAPVTITAGNSEVVTVRFSPTAVGAQSGDLEIASDDADEPLVIVSLDGNGVEPPPNEPDISVSPTSLDFGTITTGTSADLLLTVSNVGAVDLNVSSVTTDNGVFTLESPTAPFVVTAGGSEDVTIRFSPTVDGTETGTLTILSDDPNEGSVDVGLSGTGGSTPAVAYRINSGGPDYTAQSGDLFVADKAYTAGDFGYTGNPRVFTFGSAIANTSDDTMYQTIRSSFTVNYAFDLADGDYTVILHFMEPWQSAAGERLFDVNIEGVLVLDDYDIFAAAGGQFTAVTETFNVNVADGQLNIDLSRVNRVAMISAIEVTGGSTTPTPDISVSPTSLDFGDVVVGSTADQTVTLTNVGTADLTINSFNVTDAAFSVVSPTAPVTIGAGGNEVVTVRFSPTVLGAASGDLEINSDDPDEATVTVSLDGNGIDTPPDEPDISVNPTSLAFGSVTVGSSASLDVTITNSGTQLLTVSDLSSSNSDFTVTGPATPFDVAASGGTQAVTIQFSPSTTGAVNGDLTITSNDPDEGTVIVPLSGSGIGTGTTYADVTGQVGISAVHTLHGTICGAPPIGSGSAWADYDNDGDYDVYMTNHGGANYLFRNDGDTNSDGLPDFTDVAGTLGVQRSADLSTGVNFVDYDNDGDQDLYVLNWDGNTLYENQLIETGSVSFTDVTATAGVADSGRAITVSWADFDNDGLLDFHLAKHRRCSGDAQSEDHLYHNNGDGTFSDVSSYLCGGASTCDQLTGLGFMSGWFDYDNDGDQDLFLINDDIGGSNYPNVMWRNDGPDGSGGWLFTDVSAAANLDVSLNGMGLGVGDYNNDGFFDVAFSNIAPARLMQNDGDGTFTDVSDASGVTSATPQGTWGTAFFDYNHDMFVDLFIVSGGIGSQPTDHPDVLLQNDGNGTTFTNVSAASGLDDPGWGRSASMIDFDQDGWIDMVIGNYSEGYNLYRNQSADQGSTNNWIAVTVEGTESNRDGIGTRLTLTANGETQMREINSGSTHGGGDFRAAVFGLAGASSGSLVIDWPNGESETIVIDGTNLNQYIHRAEPPSTPPPATTFVDVTTQIDMSLNHTLDTVICIEPPIGSGSAWADYDNDGDIDFFATNHGGANWFYRNDGDTDSDGLPDYTNIAASLGLEDANLLSHSANFIDYDNDGDQDLYVTHYDGNTLYENQLVESGSATFTDVTSTAGVADDGRAITSVWADFNQDGWLDFYVAKHLKCAGDPSNQDRLYENNGDGTFTDVSSYMCGGASTCSGLEGLGFTAAFFDMEEDGDLDLYVVNDNIGGTYQTNQLWRNDGPDGSGGWIFTNVSVGSGADLDVNGMGLAVGDYNNDGLMDLAFSDFAPAHLLQNNGDGTFTEVSVSSGVDGITTNDVTWGSAFLDYDNDGWLDLFMMAGDVHQPSANDPNVFMVNNGDGTFTDARTSSGLDEESRGRSASMVDFDLDGYVDLFAGNYGYPSIVYHNQSSAQGNTNNWLAVTVEGTESNRDGIGTRLMLTAGGITQIRDINSGPTHGGGDYRAAYFGLASASSGSLVIDWPNGESETIVIDGTNLNQYIHRVEPPSTPPPTTTFVDVTSLVGFNVPHTLSSVVCSGPPLGSGSAWADYDNDGDIDAFITNDGAANWLYRNDGDTNSDGLPNYTDVAASLGVDDPGGVAHSAVFIDYDNDGDQDLYVTNWNDGTQPHGNVLYENQLIETGSVSFVDVTATAGIADDGRAITAGWGDFDNDGFLDVYLAKHTSCGSDPSIHLQDHLYRNNGDGTFTDYSEFLCTTTGGTLPCPGDIEGRGFSPGWFDYDNDGDADLYLVNDINASTNPNRMWRNDGAGCGGWCFTEVSAAAGTDLAVNGMGLGIGDMNNDGFLDIAFSDVGLAHLLSNNGDGTFDDISLDSGMPAGVTWGTVFFDYDNDGWLDLFLASGSIHDPNNNPADLMLRNRGGDGVIDTFEDVSNDTGLNHTGRGRHAAIVDFDNDGYVDLIVGNYGQDYRLYRNTTGDGANPGHFLNITVEGTDSNRDGIGTRVIVTAGGVTQIREISSGPTHGGGDYRAAYFGLGSETSATVTIEWPNGEVQNLGTVSADQMLHYVEPAVSGPSTDFANVTAVAGISGTHQLGSVCEPPIGSGSAWADMDNDGDVDLYITNRGGANWLYRNDGDISGNGVPNFTNVAATLGVDDPNGAGLGTVFIDYDNDGDQDLFVANWENDNTESTYHGNILYENQLIETGSLAFVELANTGLSVVEGRTITAAWADIDEDGFLDVFLTKHKECSANEEDNNDQLFKNNGDGTFTDVTSWLCGGASVCTPIEDGLGFSPGFVDYDNDGDLDLYLVNDIIGGDFHPNTLWRNDGPDGSGGWIMTDVSVGSGADVGLNGMGLAMGDYDNDGWFDFAFSNIGPVGVLHNEGDGTFTDASSASGVASNTTGATWATAFFDHNNDGWLDLYAAAGSLHGTDPAVNFFLENDGTGVFTNYISESGLGDDGRARSMSMADFNGDGWMDVFVGNYGEEFALYLNQNTDRGNTNNWLSFTVEGTESNRDGIGTRIIVTANGVTQMREITTGPTHGGGDHRVALFGIGAETSATVTVQWPNGEVENLGSITADQQMHLVEPASTP